MHPPCGSRHSFSHFTLTVLSVLALSVSCSPPVQKPSGPAYDYDAAKDMFKRGRFDKAIEFSDALATASPPNAFTERAQVLRAVIFSGRLRAYEELESAYNKGATTTKNPRFEAEYQRLRHDNLQMAGQSALALAETAHQLSVSGTLPKEVTLEASYPTTEGPIELADLEKVRQGAWIEPDAQDAVANQAVFKGIDDALADVVSGDRSKARTALATGSTKLDGISFALYVGKGLVDGAVMFDRKHGRDSQRLKTMCTEADEIVKATLALLKDNPDKDKEKDVKKLQDQIKSTLRNL